MFVLILCAAPLLAQTRTSSATVDPDTVYKNNCTRCHSAVRQYSPSMTATIVNHMRVRANLTEAETNAVLQYLAESAPTKSNSAQRNSATAGDKQAQP